MNVVAAGRRPDLFVVLSILGLVLFSLFNLLGIDNKLFVNQLLYFLIGFIVFGVTLRIGTHFFRLNHIMLYVFFTLLFVTTFIIGDSIRGSKRWIDLYFFQLQPSEFFKPFWLLILADYFSKHKLLTKSQWFFGFVLFFIPFIIIFKQPDLGNAIIYFVIFFSLIFLAGFPIKTIIYSIIIGIILMPVSWQFLREYQKNRIISFINPEIDKSGIAYNLIQSVITVGSGGIWGRGLGLGTQSRFRFLPENHTDFAFASLVEQFGFIGGATIIILNAIIIYRLIKRAGKKNRGSFEYFFLMGVIIFMLISMLVNIGMNLGIFPVTGIALPFISYGGSSAVSTFIMLGLALSI